MFESQCMVRLFPAPIAPAVKTIQGRTGRRQNFPSRVSRMTVVVMLSTISSCRLGQVRPVKAGERLQLQGRRRPHASLEVCGATPAHVGEFGSSIYGIRSPSGSSAWRGVQRSHSVLLTRSCPPSTVQNRRALPRYDPGPSPPPLAPRAHPRRCRASGPKAPGGCPRELYPDLLSRSSGRCPLQEFGRQHSLPRGRETQISGPGPLCDARTPPSHD